MDDARNPGSPASHRRLNEYSALTTQRLNSSPAERMDERYDWNINTALARLMRSHLACARPISCSVHPLALPVSILVLYYGVSFFFEDRHSDRAPAPEET